MGEAGRPEPVLTQRMGLTRPPSMFAAGGQAEVLDQDPQWVVATAIRTSRTRVGPFGGQIDDEARVARLGISGFSSVRDEQCELGTTRRR